MRAHLDAVEVLTRHVEHGRCDEAEEPLLEAAAARFGRRLRGFRLACRHRREGRRVRGSYVGKG